MTAIRKSPLLGSAAMMLLITAAGCTRPLPELLPPVPPVPETQDQKDGLLDGPPARVTIAPGEQAAPIIPKSAQVTTRSGDIAINLPDADVRVAAKAVLGDILHVPYTVDPSATGTVSVVTASPVARASVLEIFEKALKAANLALVPQGKGFQISATGSGAAVGTIAPTATGYGTEIITLQFVNAEELKRLLDSLVPGTVSSIDQTRNTLVIAGTTGQRAAVRDILRQFDVNWLRNMNFGLFVPQRTDARLIAPELDKLINDPSAPTRGLVRLIAMEKLNGILAITAQRQYLDDVHRWVDILDREGQSSEARLFVYPVQNGRARDLAKTLNTAFGFSTAGAANTTPADPLAPPGAAPAPAPTSGTSGVDDAANKSAANQRGSASSMKVTISADETNNAIIVFGTPHDYAIVEQALRKLDILPYQVMIEAAITEVSLTDDLRFGVQWNFAAGNSNFTLSNQSDGTIPATGGFPGFSYFYSNNNDITATLNSLEKRTNVKVISAPKLLVLNNQTAALQVGDQVPITTQSATSVTTSNPAIVNSVEYRDTGVILKVTPRVNASGLVLLDIAQEVSDVSRNDTSSISSPIISTRRISTSIAAQDGQVIALGGMFRNSQSFGKNGIPYLSRLPVVGGLLFGNKADTQKRTELLVILKAHVLRSVDDGRAITEELRAKLRTLEPFRTKGKIP